MTDAGRDGVDRQRAFTGVLTHPVVDRVRHPELFALIRHPRHRPVLTDWFSSRLGYRLVVTDTAVRLFRLPIGGDVVAPRRFAPPPRRAMVLAVLAAAAAEDAEDVTNTQDLSDRVRALTQHEAVDLAPYDPDRFSDRQLFVRAIQLLADAGPLRPVDRDAEDRREGWAHRRDGVGGAYQVDRELLLRMVEPAALAAALGRHPEPPEHAARFGLMRRLLELPVCLLADLTEAERQYLAGQRHRVAAWCTEMTGWVLEQRAEGLALVASVEEDTDVSFPRLRAVDFVTLMLLDELHRGATAGEVLPDMRLDAAVAEVRARYPKAMTKELATDLQVRERGVELLRALDLLRPVRGGWWLSPAAARYRNPAVVAVTSRLEPEEAR